MPENATEFSDLTSRDLRNARIQARLDINAAADRYDHTAQREAKSRLDRLLAETARRLQRMGNSAPSAADRGDA